MIVRIGQDGIVFNALPTIPNTHRYIYVYVYGNKNIKNTLLIKRYSATCVAFSSSIKIEILDKVKQKLNLQISFS